MVIGADPLRNFLALPGEELKCENSIEFREIV
jgi:hypothetical protein